jgi:hypothetical protein
MSSKAWSAQTPMRMTAVLLIERDLDTGLMAMAKGVGYPASIVAQMLVRGEITARGVLTPTRHVPAAVYRTAWRAGHSGRGDRRAPAVTVVVDCFLLSWFPYINCERRRE